MALKYKVGDKVRIKSINWYNENKTSEYGDIDCGAMPFMNYMTEFCGQIVTISHIDSMDECYEIEEDGGENGWTDEMIEELVDDEIAQETKTFSEGYNQGYEDGQHDMNEWILPEGFEFHDENGNVINATKIVLEKKKKEYPKTYEECCVALEYIPHTDDVIGYKWNILQSLQKLLICRDAYWKIAGGEMGLGKPWEPDWKNSEEKRYCIVNIEGDINLPEKVLTKWILKVTNKILVFPTAEMRDAFYENFKDLIEQCKELL